MKNKLIASYSLSIVLLLGVFTSIVFAGTEPSPFQPEINELNAVVNQLNTIEYNLQNTLTLPADETGLINQLETISNKLDLLNNKVRDVKETLQVPPDDIKVEEALFSVQENTQEIIDIAEEYLGTPPDPISPAFREALEIVIIEATFLKNQVFHRIHLLLSTPSILSSMTTFVMHGWVTGGTMFGIPVLNWSAMDPTQQNEFINTASFELSIDGIPVELERLEWYNQESDKKYVGFYIVFPPGYFTAGNTYAFEGFWSIKIDESPYTHTETRTITAN
jgi:hypothetical protein